MKLKNRRWSRCFLWLICIIVLNGGYSHEAVAQGINLSPKQVKQLKKLSPKEKKALAAKAGIKLGKPQAQKKVKSPVVATPRQVKKAVAPAAKVNKPKKETLTSIAKGPPIAKLNQEAAKRLALRPGFTKLVSGLKPLSVDAQLSQFGYELFAGTPTTFAPATEIPVPPEYVLGPGDEIKVQLFGKENAQYSMTVDREGAIAFPGIGPLAVAGMNFAEGRAFIAQQIKEKMIGVSASITMGKLRSIRIFALGEVNRPGSYVVSGLATLSSALFASGGVKKTGSLRKIILKRNGKEITTLDLYDFLLHGDTSHDVRLLPQDVVFVPPIGKTVGVAGQVLRPAIYELKSETTVADALKLAGGLRPTAYKTKIQVRRISKGKELIVFDLPLKGSGPVRHLEDGDLIKVFAMLDFEKNPIYLLGNVKRPGKYAWHKNMRMKELIRNTDALLPETYMKYGIIERESSVGREPMVIHFSLKSVLAGKVRVALKPRDKVYIFNQSHFREQPKITVTGSVQAPGGYELKKNMHLIDLILVARGLMRDANRDDAELYRTDPESKEVTVFHYSIAKAFKGDKTSNPLLQDMDRLVVHKISYSERVTIQGEVIKPGKYVRAANMRVADLLFAAGGVTPDALLDEAQIYRTDPDTKAVSLLTFNVGKALKEYKANNPLLEDLDRIVIHSIYETLYSEKITIQGEVKKPGDYMRAKNMHVADLIFAAGGITRDILLDEAQIYRTDPDTKAVSLLTFNVGKALKGDKTNNPLLEGLDRVVIHSIYETRYRENVTIQGEVKKPKEYVRAKNMRAADLIFAAGGVTRDVLLDEAQIYRTDPDTKAVSLITFNVGKALKGDKTNNPLLEDLDRVVIHSIWEVKWRYQVSVGGEIKKPGDYTLAKGMRVSDLVFAAGNVTDRAYLKKAEITHYQIIDGEKRVSQHIQINLESALRGDMDDNILLQPYDVLTIRRLSHWRNVEHVTVEGEVRFPGAYPVEEGERLSELLERVGGFTDKAYLPAAVFTRESIRKQQQQQLDELAKRVENEISRQTVINTNIKDSGILQRQQRSLESAKRVLAELQGVKATGRLVIHLEDIADLRGTYSDLRLRDGDRLYIPQRPDEVMVIGQVYNQTALLYSDKFNRNDYIDLAGGVTRFADSDNIYIVRASGEVQGKKGRSFRRYRFKHGKSGGLGRHASVQPGDVIIVPEKLERFMLIDSMLDWSRVLMQVGVGVASMKTLGIL